MKIPFFDLSRQYLSIQNKIDKTIAETLAKASFIGGSEVEAFEEKFSRYIGVSYVISCGNGTDALEIILQGIGIQKGDEVIVPTHSWVSTASAVASLGAKPVFVDTLPYRYTIDPAGIEKAISPKTRAIIPVHLYGCPAEMDEICAIAEKHRLFVLEDCAQAHGALYRGRKVGTFGHAASFSFYPTKNLGAYGDAGAMLTNDPALAEKLRMLSNYGQKVKHQHLINGRNSRLDTLQATILNVKLPYLDEWNSQRRKHAQLYFNLLKHSSLHLPDVPAYIQPVYHLFVIQAAKREEIAKFLKANGIATAIHYPALLSDLAPYKKPNSANNYPVSQSYQHSILSLPMYPELRVEEIEYIAEKILFFLNHK